MVEVSTDKVDAEVPAPAAARSTKILVQPDETIEVGKPLAEIDPNGAASGGGGRGAPPRMLIRATATAAPSESGEARCIRTLTRRARRPRD